MQCCNDGLTWKQGGAQFSAVCVGSYVNDAYYSISIEVFIIIMIIKNFLFYAFSRKSSMNLVEGIGRSHDREADSVLSLQYSSMSGCSYKGQRCSSTRKSLDHNLSSMLTFGQHWRDPAGSLLDHYSAVHLWKENPTLVVQAGICKEAHFTRVRQSAVLPSTYLAYR